MKLTCMMIVAVMFLTASIFITADNSRNGIENLPRMRRHEMKKPKASKLNKRVCIADDMPCGFGLFGGPLCCSGWCLFVCL
uniref:Omega-conotoxin-like 2/7 n=1 Tax=Conus imperialis TaxID=35631 RepID=O162_CONIM|nr:RecName: Full=Omega-conotoxin-like 2/7; Flags: Precursor [Conus imperialis]CAH64858.1 four-loop conotoxin prepropeptide [Conus imperialis]CAH64862.1 four-loop conotoxin prepropeptide [Conus imperialis]